jgi:hypothetical protein
MTIREEEELPPTHTLYTTFYTLELHFFIIYFVVVSL